MEARRVRCSVNVAGGPSRRVGPSGLLIGRKEDCDIVSADPSVSRRHAMIRLTSDGAEVIPLGRGSVEVNGKKADRPTELGDGDVLVVPGLTLNVELSAQRPDKAAVARWSIERERGGSFGIVHSPFVIGGNDHSDLIVKRWPDRALRFHLAQGAVIGEACVAGVTRNGRELELGELEPLDAGDVLVFRTEQFTVRQASHDATTVASSVVDLPTRVTVEILPRGGRVVLATADGDRPVFLADRRLDFVIALLRPPAGFNAGDFIPDDVVRPIVWPRNPGVSRPEINVLISRCRRDFVEAGLAGPRLVERAPGGGATRFALAAGATVVVES